MTFIQNRDGSTETVQNQQELSIEEVKSAVLAIAGAKGTASDLRVTLLGGTTAVTGSLTSAGTVSTVTTVTTVTTLTGITNIGSQPATTMLPAINNQVVVSSNINNVSVT